VGVRAAVEWVAAGIVAGELLANTGAAAPALVACAAGCALALRYRPSRALVAPVAGLAGMAAGWAIVALALGRPLAPGDVAHLPLPVRARLVGRVATVPAARQGRTVVIVVAESVDRGGGPQPTSGRIRLTIRGAAPDLARGERIAVWTTLRRPRNFGNPGCFDFLGHLARRGIRSTASVWDGAEVVRLARPTPGFVHAIDAWRASVAAALGHVQRLDVRAVLTALVLGDEGSIDDRLRLAFTRAGVVHVLSVSGLHVGIVAGTATLAIAWLLGRSERLLLATDVRKAALVASVVPTVLYGALAGFETATLRSVVMTCAVVSAAVLGRDARPLRALALATIAVALEWPGAPLEISFQLSFASVLALVLWAGRAHGSAGGRSWTARLRVAAGASFAAWVATAPLTALHFHQVSLAAVVANPLVVPLFGGVVLVPALVAALAAPLVPSVAAWLFQVAAMPTALGVDLVERIGGFPMAAVATPIPTAVEVVACYALVATLWLEAGRRRGVLVVVALVLLGDIAWWVHERSAPGRLRVTFLDVGQGDAAVVELPDGRVLVVDGGGFPGSDFDTGSAVVEPFLRTRKIASVDAVVMTHAHPDHASGLARVVSSFEVGELWWNGAADRGSAWRALAEACAVSGVPERALRAGDTVPRFPDVDVVHPPAGWIAPSLNDGSLVLRVRYGDVAVLLTGDVEAAAEERLLRGGPAIAAAVVKVPHHGSATSSGDDFVSAVAPRIAVVSVGSDNRYGHPSSDVVARYRRAGARVLRTDRCGAVTIETNGRDMEVTTFRPACETPH